MAVCVFSTSSVHICVLTKTTKQFYTIWVSPLYPLATPQTLSTHFFFFNFFLTFPNVHSPGDIWVLTADHYIVTAPAFVILDVEKWQVAPIKWQTSKEWHYCNRHVMNGKIESLCSFHLIFDKKKMLVSQMYYSNKFPTKSYNCAACPLSRHCVYQNLWALWHGLQC